MPEEKMEIRLDADPNDELYQAFQGVNSILVVVGEIMEEYPYQKSTAIQQLKQGDRQVPIEIHKRSKDSSHNQTLFEQIISRISEGEQDKTSGNFVQEWQNVYKNFKQDFEEADIASGIAYVLAIKDDEELQLSEDVENMLYTKDEKWLTSHKSLQDVRIILFKDFVGFYVYVAYSNFSILHESAYNLNQKNTKELKAGMVLNLFIGFIDLENPKATDEKNQRRKKHQEELAARKQADGLARFSEKSNEKASQHKAVFRSFESYKRDTALPKEVKDLKSESIILPVFGFAVPFHISTLKNVNKSEEGEYVYLRLNFLTPGQATGKKEDNPFDDPSATFVRAFTYRSTDQLLSEIYKKIIDLKKAAAKRKEMADLIAQDKLIEIKVTNFFKKSEQDIQFYREASDVQFDETGNRKRKYRYGDEDELGAEQEERRRRALLNKEFKQFAEKVSEASEGRVDVDIPFREIGFQGVPFRTNVLLQPTTECLVHLTDPPFLVVPLADIEIAHLERVQNEDSAASSDSASEYMQSEESYEESSSDGSSFDEEASDVNGSESEEESDESAPDWDEHEEKARR
ncbi:18012_t:CDS:10, partial [Racocetra fulgida]